jgi:hypothetical protein
MPASGGLAPATTFSDNLHPLWFWTTSLWAKQVSLDSIHLQVVVVGEPCSSDSTESL